MAAQIQWLVLLTCWTLVFMLWKGRIHNFLYRCSVPSLHLYLPLIERQTQMAECNKEECFGAQDVQQKVTGKKYGGLGPKKPLISKDHERAFFDSADWALCKQGAAVNQQSTAALETLQPKLQKTPHQQLPPRKPACTSGEENVVSSLQ
ncbi:Endosulphine protein [Spatholobus suberectus]|nr:Endosulphine protein [Spatholobus suberectus]